MSKRLVRVLAVNVPLLMLSATPAHSEGWRIEPLFDSQIWHSDNLRRAGAGNEQAGTFGTLEPGVAIRRVSSRLDLSLDYKMLNVFYDDGSDSETHHRAAADATLELVSDRLFVAVDGQYRQSLVDSRSDFGSDIFSDPDAFTDSYSFRIAPYWTERFDGYVDFVARYEYEVVRYDRGRGDNNSNAINLSLESGERFTSYSWRVEYSRSGDQVTDQQFDDDSANDDLNDDLNDERFFAEAAFPLSETLSVGARGGYESSNVRDIDDEDTPDGTFWSIGALWNPNRIVESSLFLGPDDSEFRLKLSPSARTDFEAIWKDRSVGIDNGSNLTLSFEHRSQSATWLANFSEGLVASGLLNVDDDFINFAQVIEDESGDSAGSSSVFNDQGQLDSVRPSFSLTDDDFDRRTFSAGVRFNRARTEFEAISFYEDRNFGSGEDENSVGVASKISRQLGSNTTATLALDWEKIDGSTNQQDTVINIQALLSYRFSPDLGAGLAYRYVDRDSDEDDRDFRENRLGALLRMKF